MRGAKSGKTCAPGFPAPFGLEVFCKKCIHIYRVVWLDQLAGNTGAHLAKSPMTEKKFLTTVFEPPIPYSI